MITILVDHDIEGQAMLLWADISSEGWPELFLLEFLLFQDVGLSPGSNDREVWRYAQSHGMILLTANRRMKEESSLERTIRNENTSSSLPVLTIGNKNRVIEKEYRERCGSRLLDVILYLDNYLGAGRIFIP
jgi:predicted nuclease of predicted toxin-antitoxin system